MKKHRRLRFPSFAFSRVCLLCLSTVFGSTVSEIIKLAGLQCFRALRPLSALFLPRRLPQTRPFRQYHTWHTWHRGPRLDANTVMNWSASVLSTVSSDTEPVIIVTFDQAKYIFNAGESSGRVWQESKEHWRKTKGVFLTSVGTRNGAGLAGEFLRRCASESCSIPWTRPAYVHGGHGHWQVDHCGTSGYSALHGTNAVISLPVRST